MTEEYSYEDLARRLDKILQKDERLVSVSTSDAAKSVSEGIKDLTNSISMVPAEEQKPKQVSMPIPHMQMPVAYMPQAPPEPMESVLRRLKKLRA